MPMHIADAETAINPLPISLQPHCWRHFTLFPLLPAGVVAFDPSTLFSGLCSSRAVSFPISAKCYADLCLASHYWGVCRSYSLWLTVHNIHIYVYNNVTTRGIFEWGLTHDEKPHASRSCDLTIRLRTEDSRELSATSDTIPPKVHPQWPREL